MPRWLTILAVVVVACITTHVGNVHVLPSSTVRTDTGNGACEVMWVDRVQINDTLWE